MTHAKEQISEAFKKLPEDIRNAIFSIDTAAIIQEIGTKHKLMIDKIGELADETGLVMLGLTHPKDYITNLSEKLNTDREIAKEIAEEINSRIFSPIREHLKKIHGLMGEPESSKLATKSDFVASPKPPENLPVSPEPKSLETLTPQKVEVPVPPKANIEIDPYREPTASST